MSELVTITSYSEPIEAHIVKGRLEAEGITAFIANEYHISVAWFLSSALGGVKILVHKQDQNKAENIIKSLRDGEYEKDLEKEINVIESNICPNCGSEDYLSKFSLPLLLLVWLSLGLAVIFPIRRNKHTCVECGCKWVY